MALLILSIIAWVLYSNWKKKQEQGGGNTMPPAGNQQSITQQQAPPPNVAPKIQCPNCGGENTEGSYFCVHCGKKM